MGHVKFYYILVEDIEDTDYVICIVDRLIEDDADGLGLAKTVNDVTGIPLQRIAFWHHARDNDLDQYQVNYRKHYMINVIDK